MQQKHFNDTAVNTGDAGLKVINCNIFGGAMGMGVWRPAVDLEVYGNLIHDFGYYNDNLRGSGHAAYIQNDQGTKRFEHNIAYRGCGWNYDIYTQGGEIKGIDLIENIGYIASWHKPGQVGFNFGLTGFKPAERIRFIGNVGYHSRSAEQRWRSNMRLMASKPEAFHHDAVVKDNYIMGTCRALVLSRWQNIEVTGNTFWATDFLTEISSAASGSGIAENPPRPELKNYRVDRNTYYDNGKPRPFIYSAHENALDEEQLTFAQWQALGLDKHSQMLPGKAGRPTGTKVFVFPNKVRERPGERGDLQLGRAGQGRGRLVESLDRRAEVPGVQLPGRQADARPGPAGAQRHLRRRRACNSPCSRTRAARISTPSWCCRSKVNSRECGDGAPHSIFLSITVTAPRHPSG